MLVKIINMPIKHIKNSKSLDSFLKLVKKISQEKKEAKEKGTWAPTGVPASSTERSPVGEKQ